MTVYSTPISLSSKTITRIEIITPRIYLMDIPPLWKDCTIDTITKSVFLGIYFKFTS